MTFFNILARFQFKIPLGIRRRNVIGATKPSWKATFHATASFITRAATLAR